MKLFIGDIIQKLRKIKGLTQEQVANALGITTSSVSKWVCQVFCVSFKKIFWGGEPPHLYHPTLLNDTLLKCFGNISNRVSCQ